MNINPALPASWNALQVLFKMTGQRRGRDAPRDTSRSSRRLPPEVVTATSLFADGEISPAERSIRDFLLKHGDHVEGMRLLAKIGMKLDVLDDAELLLESALMLAPDYHAARYDYVLTLLQRHKHAQALEEIDKLLKIDPGNRAYRTTHATACVGVGDHEQALAALPRAARRDAASRRSASVGRARPEDARQAAGGVDSYRTAAACRPSYGDAYWSLANLKTYRFPDAEIAQMRAAGERRRRSRASDRYHLCFALGKALEDRGEYAESFGYYERGNALKKAETALQDRADRAQCAAAGRRVHARVLRGAARLRLPRSGDPIFIVGLPRAGSTLLEQILASHSKVEGTMELPNILRLVQQLQGRDPDTTSALSGVLAELDAERFQQLGEKYLADTRIYRTGKPLFIDKMPNNFRHIGLIHLILPNAKIIDARREPMACCFSNFKQLFASGQEFTYSIEDIARYYRSYVELMDHWDDGAAGQDPARSARGRGRGSRGQRAPHPRVLRPGFRARLPGVLQDRAQRAHGELRAGAPADLQGRPRPVAAFRALAGAAEERAGRPWLKAPPRAAAKASIAMIEPITARR